MVVKVWKSEKLDLTIEVDYDKCKGYAECVDVCPTNVYELVDGKATAPMIDECIECCSCVEVCPAAAIKHSSC